MFVLRLLHSLWKGGIFNFGDLIIHLCKGRHAYQKYYKNYHLVMYNQLPEKNFRLLIVVEVRSTMAICNHVIMIQYVTIIRTLDFTLNKRRK
jgi:hypothetical protein